VARGPNAGWNFRYRKVMRLLLCFLLSAGTFVLADETADRSSVEQTVSGLSSVQREPALFTADFEGFPDLERLNIQLATVPVHFVPPTWHVIISKEPWGEATWDLGSVSPVVLPISRFVIKSVRFVTSDVALVRADCEQFEPSIAGDDHATPLRRIPVLVILRRAGETFRITSFHIAG
jgi:hypothetical protein